MPSVPRVQYALPVRLASTSSFQLAPGALITLSSAVLTLLPTAHSAKTPLTASSVRAVTIYKPRGRRVYSAALSSATARHAAIAALASFVKLDIF